MLTFLNLQPEVFGIDVNDFSLRIVKLKKERGGFSIVSFNEIAIKPGIVKEGVIQDQEALAKSVMLACNSVKGRKLGTKYAVIALPEEKSFSQVIQMPAMTEKELASAVPFEAENYIPLTIDKVYLDFQVINDAMNTNAAGTGAATKEKPNHVNVLVNVMPKNIIDAYVSSFKKAGLIPYVLEVESQAIVRALTKKGDANLPTIFIDLGQDNTGLIIYSGNAIRFTCSIPISSGQLTQAITGTMPITTDKAEKLKIEQGLVTKKHQKNHAIAAALDPILSDLAAQIQKYIDFYYGHISHTYVRFDGKIEKLVLCGGGANLKNLPDFLSKKLGIPVWVGDPLTNIIVKKRDEGRGIPAAKLSSFTTALGLALRAAESNIYD